MRRLAATSTLLGEDTVCELHRRIVARSQPAIAGIYSTLPRRIAGSADVFPNAAKRPDLMDAFGCWLSQAPADPTAAFDGHFRLTAIHPFADGNGRTAWLLMNVMLIWRGYPPVTVRPEDRKAYLDALKTGSVGDDLGPFQARMLTRLDATLDEYLGVLQEALPVPRPAPSRGRHDVP